MVKEPASRKWTTDLKSTCTTEIDAMHCFFQFFDRSTYYVITGIYTDSQKSAPVDYC